MTFLCKQHLKSKTLPFFYKSYIEMNASFIKV